MTHNTKNQKKFKYVNHKQDHWLKKKRKKTLKWTGSHDTFRFAITSNIWGEANLWISLWMYWCLDIVETLPTYDLSFIYRNTNTLLGDI